MTADDLARRAREMADEQARADAGWLRRVLDRHEAKRVAAAEAWERHVVETAAELIAALPKPHTP